MKSNIFSIQRFSTHDGPGIRTTVFFTGCNLHCRWCHNPEGLTSENRILLYPERCIGCKKCADFCTSQLFSPNRIIDRAKCTLCGKCADFCPTKALESTLKVKDNAEIIFEVLKDKAFYGDTGGLTVSGGEPVLQHNAVCDLLKKAKENGINTAIETNCHYPKEFLTDIVKYTDLFLCDYKDSNVQRLKDNTGAELDIIEDNIRYIDSQGKRIRLRCILIHGINTDIDNAEKIKAFADSIKNLDGIDIIKYHPMGESKYSHLGIADTFDKKDYIPTNEDIELFGKILSTRIK